MALPKDYEAPEKPSNYMKFQDGKNKFRVLSDIIVGYEWWVENDNGTCKPVRSKPADLAKHNAPDDAVKWFWSMIVWNYQASRIQILNITQARIQKEIEAYEDNEDWGDSKNYDITVTRSGEKMLTKYSVQPSPHKQVAPEVIEALNATSIDLNALFDGKDPFKDIVDEALDIFDSKKK